MMIIILWSHFVEMSWSYQNKAIFMETSGSSRILRLSPTSEFGTRRPINGQGVERQINPMQTQIIVRLLDKILQSHFTIIAVLAFLYYQVQCSTVEGIT